MRRPRQTSPSAQNYFLGSIRVAILQSSVDKCKQAVHFLPPALYFKEPSGDATPGERWVGLSAVRRSVEVIQSHTQNPAWSLLFQRGRRSECCHLTNTMSQIGSNDALRMLLLFHVLPLCVCVCVLPRIQADANLSELSVTDGETITCHLKKKRWERRELWVSEVTLLRGTKSNFHPCVSNNPTSLWSCRQIFVFKSEENCLFDRTHVPVRFFLNWIHKVTVISNLHKAVKKKEKKTDFWNVWLMPNWVTH